MGYDNFSEVNMTFLPSLSLHNSLTLVNVQHEAIEVNSLLFGHLHRVIEHVHQHRLSRS